MCLIELITVFYENFSTWFKEMEYKQRFVSSTKYRNEYFWIFNMFFYVYVYVFCLIIKYTI